MTTDIPARAEQRARVFKGMALMSLDPLVDAADRDVWAAWSRAHGGADVDPAVPLLADVAIAAARMRRTDDATAYCAAFDALDAALAALAGDEP